MRVLRLCASSKEARPTRSTRSTLKREQRTPRPQGSSHGSERATEPVAALARAWIPLRSPKDHHRQNVSVRCSIGRASGRATLPRSREDGAQRTPRLLSRERKVSCACSRARQSVAPHPSPRDHHRQVVSVRCSSFSLTGTPPQPEHAKSVNNVPQGSSHGSERTTTPVAALARAWIPLRSPKDHRRQNVSVRCSRLSVSGTPTPPRAR